VHLKGRKITCASTERIGEFVRLPAEFMEHVFDLK